MLVVLLFTLIISTANKSEPGSSSLPTSAEPETVGKSHFIDVPSLTQVEILPSGCESVSAVMALNYAGVDISVDAFISGYLPMSGEPRIDEDDGSLMGESPNEYYIGSPYSEFGYGCYSPVILKAINGVLSGTRTGNSDSSRSGSERRPPAGDDVNAEATQDEADAKPANYDLTAVDLSGSSLAQLCDEYIDNDIPVIIWATIQMKPVEGTVTWLMLSGEEFIWKSGEHCLLLVGYDDKCYYFNDPIEGKDVAYLRANVEQAYEELYKQAIAVVST